MENRNLSRVDIVGKVYFFPSCLGGRPTPAGDFRCSIVIDKSKFKVCLHLCGAETIPSGQAMRVPISFLEREGAPHCCFVDGVFVLREEEPIGLGLIEALGPDHKEDSAASPMANGTPSP